MGVPALTYHTISAGQLSPSSGSRYCVNPGIAGLNAAQKWFAGLGEQHGADASASHQDKCIKALEHIHKHELRTRGHSSTRWMDNVTVYGLHGNRGRVSTLSFNITNMPADQGRYARCGPRRVYALFPLHPYACGLGHRRAKGAVRTRQGTSPTKKTLSKPLPASPT